MVAARKPTKRAGRAKAARAATAGHEPGLEEIRIKYDPVMIALSKAEAARCLLVKNHDGLLDDDDTVDWVESFADDALSDALVEAKAAYVKAVATGTAANPKATKDTEPAAEVAR